MPFRRAFRRPSFRCTSLLRTLLLPAVLLSLAAAGPVRASITGVCPDGSVFIVQDPSAIPCKDHKEVEPGNVPPIKAEYLPRPYAWEVFNHQQDPNNPYNLVDEAQKVREAGRAGGSPSADAGTTRAPMPPVGAGPAPQTAATPGQAVPITQTALVRPEPAPPQPQPELGLTDREVHDLFLIVHLAQRVAPATFEPENGRAVTVRLAQSTAFEPRLRQAQRDLPPGPVLLFAAVAEGPADFHANLTFVQGHEAFQPDHANPRELGLIRGRLGQMQADEAVLGYVVLPARIDLGQPLDIYWNDRQLTATLRP